MSRNDVPSGKQSVGQTFAQRAQRRVDAPPPADGIRHGPHPADVARPMQRDMSAGLGNDGTLSRTPIAREQASNQDRYGAGHEQIRQLIKGWGRGA